MPVVVPLAEKPADDACEHIAYESPGKTNVGGEWFEWRRCEDCGHKWKAKTDGPPQAEEKPGEPPKAVYGHAQVVTYQTERGQYDLVVGELAMVSIQGGVLVIQHPQVAVTGITGVRPWVVPEGDSDADAQG